MTNFGLQEVRGRAALAAAHDEHFDLIMTMGFGSHRLDVGPLPRRRAPVLSVCSKDPVVLGQSPGYNKGSGTNFAFTSLNMPIEAQMAYVNELKPRLKNIAILVDSRNISAVETQSKPVIDYLRPRGVRVMELAVQTRATPSRARAHDARRHGPDDPQRPGSHQLHLLGDRLDVGVQGDRHHQRPCRPRRRAQRGARRGPGGDDSAVLSIGISFESNAHVAAVYAADLVRNRAKASELKVGLVSPPDITINFRKVRDIGMTVPLSFFEAAGTIYDYDGRAVRIDGVNVVAALK